MSRSSERVAPPAPLDVDPGTQQLQPHEAWFRAIVQTIPHMVWVSRPDGANEYNNEQLEAYTGLSSAALSGEGWMQAVHPDDLPAAASAWQRAHESGEPFAVTERVRRHDGEYRWFIARAAPLRGSDGRIVRWIGTWSDVHDRVLAEQALRDSERVYRAIGESIDYGVWVCAPDGRNVYASESFLKLVGMTQQECSDFGWGSVLHPDDADRTIAAWKECVRTEGAWDIEHRYRGVDGRWHPILARGVPVRNERGEIVCWAGINLDISRLKAAEQTLLDADRRKNEFLSVLSHELRNPLAPIVNSVALLRHAEADPEKVRRAVDVIERQAAQLARLVEDLLDISRITQGKVRLDRKPARMAEVVRRVVDDHEALFAAKRIALGFHDRAGSAWAEVDAARIAQVVGNLLQNAAKFTPPGGRVEVTLTQEDGRAVLRVEDDGVGMDQATVARLFEPFMQGQVTLDRAAGGLGLGLALAKSLVELHGGTIRASSPGLGQGAEFVVELPLASVGRADAAPRPDATRRPRRRVIVIEDNQDGAATLRDLLELEGHQVVVAHDGQQGLEAALSGDPEVVLCDLGVPSVDGYEIARRLRAHGSRARLIALTGYAAPEDVERAREAGFDDHLAKPPDLDRLFASVAVERAG